MSNIFFIGNNIQNSLAKDFGLNSSFEIILPDKEYKIDSQENIVKMCSNPNIDIILLAINYEEDILNQSMVNVYNFYCKINSKQLYVLKNNKNRIMKEYDLYIPLLIDERIENINTRTLCNNISSYIFKMNEIASPHSRSTVDGIISILSYQEILRVLGESNFNNLKNDYFINSNFYFEQSNLTLEQLKIYLSTITPQNIKEWLKIDLNDVCISREKNNWFDKMIISHFKNIRSIVNSETQFIKY